MRRPGPQTVAATAVLVLLAAVAVATSRRAGLPPPSFASTDYGADGYRAWATLLAREGLATGRFVLRPIELDDQLDTLISAQPPPASGEPATRTTADIGALAAWVRRGGKLVYLGRNVSLREAENRLLQLPAFLPAVGARGRLRGPLAAEVSSLREVGPGRMRLAGHAGHGALGDANGEIVVRYPLGRGEIVALAAALPFTNRNIAAAENARLAYLIALPRRAGGRVAFDDGLHGALIDRPWYRALPIPVRVSLALGGFALVLGLIGSALAGIPPLPLRPPREPTSVEFVEALAALHERTGGRAAARTRLAKAALAAAARSTGLAEDVAPQLLAEQIGDRRGAEALRRLVSTLGEPVTDDSALLRGAKLAQTVRKDFKHGGNGIGNDGRAAFAERARTRRRR